MLHSNKGIMTICLLQKVELQSKCINDHLQCIFNANSNTSNDNRPTNSWRRLEINYEQLVNCNKQFIIFHSIVSPITSRTPAHHRFGFFVFFLIRNYIVILCLLYLPNCLSSSFFHFFLYVSFDVLVLLLNAVL